MPVFDRTQAFGVYVHVPFCARRCDYCAFATWTDRHHLMTRYASACVSEIGAASLAPASSVFFGGGTPSLLPVEPLVAILASIPRRPDAEVTVECNPDTVDVARLEAYRAGGVTRVSFGAQSFVPHVLTSLGRTHDPESVIRAVAAAAAAGITSVSVDLIFGARGESERDWRASLAAVLGLDPAPGHVSAYALTAEPGTALWADAARHPDDDDQAAKYLIADRVLCDAGYRNYEISNWSRPGQECRHNLLYWAQGEYRGIGCAAHSHSSGRRWWNVRTPERYIDAIESGRSPIAAAEELDGETRRMERLQLALRTSAGIPSDALDGMEELEAAGLLQRTTDRVLLTPRGRLLTNEVAARLR